MTSRTVMYPRSQFATEMMYPNRFIPVMDHPEELELYNTYNISPASSYRAATNLGSVIPVIRSEEENFNNPELIAGLSPESRRTISKLKNVIDKWENLAFRTVLVREAEKRENKTSPEIRSLTTRLNNNIKAMTTFTNTLNNQLRKTQMTARTRQVRRNVNLVPIEELRREYEELMLDSSPRSSASPRSSKSKGSSSKRSTASPRISVTRGAGSVRRSPNL